MAKVKGKEAASGVPLFPLDAREAFRQIRNYLAGRFVGATRDEALLKEIIKCLFCRVYMLREGHYEESASEGKRAAAYSNIFDKLRTQLPTIFGADERLLLDSGTLAFVDQKLDEVQLDVFTEDPFADAYETFVGSAVRGQEGQFFTPQTAVQLLIQLVEPSSGETVIDPACGAGSFLAATARYLISQGLSPPDVGSTIFGLDKDRYLANLAAARLSLISLQSSNVFCADSLAWIGEGEDPFPLRDSLGTFDVVLTNPPFGVRIVSASEDIKRNFDLAHRWTWDSKTYKFQKWPELQNNVPPQVLFIERCLSLVRPGGRVGMVVPESLITGSSYRYVVDFIFRKADIIAVVGMPEALFKTSGKGGTHTKTCLIVMRKKELTRTGSAPQPIFMAEARWCGRDSRGRIISRDDLPTIAERFKVLRKEPKGKSDHLGNFVSSDKLVDHVLAPRYYDPEVAAILAQLENSHELVVLGDLVDEGLVKISSGNEVGKMSYGMGEVPFVRTSDISNWEVKIDPKHLVSEDVYQSLAGKQDVREGDILMVRDGTYLIGTCAYVTKYDTRIVFQSHLYKIRVTDPSRLSPFLLLAILSSMPVQRQIKAKRFTQDIIDSLGNRILELVIPIPKDRSLRNRVSEMVARAIGERIEARELARQACVDVLEDFRPARLSLDEGEELFLGQP